MKPLLAPHHAVLTLHYLDDCHRLPAQLSGKPTHVVRAVLVARLQPHRVSFSRPGELPADPAGERGAHRVRGGGDEGVGRDGSARRRLRRCRHDWTAECARLHLTAPRARHVRSVSRIAACRFCVELIYVLMAGEAAREAAGMRYRETGGF
eukprot:COSAG06_NODE_17465_length_939_cov_4.108333_1_plen_151_part_00